jgi:hypothetical protein
MGKSSFLPLDDRENYRGVSGGDLDALKEQLRAGYRFLAISNDRVEIADEDVLRPRYRSGFPVLIIVDLRRAMQNFTQLVGSEDRTFSLMQIAQATGMPYQKAWKWLSDGLIVATIDPAGGHGKERVFSFLDGFIACVLVNLRQNGTAMHLLPKVAQLLRSLEPPQTNGEPNKVAATASS